MATVPSAQEVELWSGGRERDLGETQRGRKGQRENKEVCARMRLVDGRLNFPWYRQIELIRRREWQAGDVELSKARGCRKRKLRV